ncbi:hypothetical protein BU17DRAFT_91558 [Hysterangium stoloniferum]|nr:hypothetical protein BU17DRAFT_91558 [Hysterangium stoloniferum]
MTESTTTPSSTTQPIVMLVPITPSTLPPLDCFTPFSEPETSCIHFLPLPSAPEFLPLPETSPIPGLSLATLSSKPLKSLEMPHIPSPSFLQVPEFLLLPERPTTPELPPASDPYTSTFLLSLCVSQEPYPPT